MTNIPPPLPTATPPPLNPPPANLSGFIPPPPPPPPQRPEFVLGMLENFDQKTGIFSKLTYRLVITDLRLIFALQQKTGYDYLHKDPSLTLSENPVNFEIPLDQLVKIETYPSGLDNTSPDYCIVITTTQKMRFDIKNYYKVQKTLIELLGSKAA